MPAANRSRGTQIDARQASGGFASQFEPVDGPRGQAGGALQVGQASGGPARFAAAGRSRLAWSRAKYSCVAATSRASSTSAAADSTGVCRVSAIREAYQPAPHSKVAARRQQAAINAARSGWRRHQRQPRQMRHRAGENRPALLEAVQVVGQVAGAGVATGRLLVQTFQTDRFQVARHVRAAAGGPATGSCSQTSASVSCRLAPLNGGRPVRHS